MSGFDGVYFGETGDDLEDKLQDAIDSNNIDWVLAFSEALKARSLLRIAQAMELRNKLIEEGGKIVFPKIDAICGSIQSVAVADAIDRDE